MTGPTRELVVAAATQAAGRRLRVLRHRIRLRLSRRTIQREVDNRLSRILLDGAVQRGQRVLVDASDGQVTFDVTG